MTEMKIFNILIAEDDEPNFLFLKINLRRLNFNVFWARDGLEAVEICAEKDIDLVLMDIGLPVMNGFEAIKILKSTYPDLPVIAQTAWAMSDDRQKIMASGFDDYIAKPYRFIELIKYINALLGL